MNPLNSVDFSVKRQEKTEKAPCIIKYNFMGADNVEIVQQDRSVVRTTCEQKMAGKIRPVIS